METILKDREKIVYCIDAEEDFCTALEQNGLRIIRGSLGYRYDKALVRNLPHPPHECDVILYNLWNPACYDASSWGPGRLNDNYRCEVVKVERDEDKLFHYRYNKKQYSNYRIVSESQIAGSGVRKPGSFDGTDILRAVKEGGVPLVYFLNPTFLMHVSSYLPLWLDLIVSISFTVANEFDLADFSDRFPQSLSKIGRDNLSFVRPIKFRIDAGDETTPVISIKLVSNRVGDTLATLISFGKGHIFFLPPFQNDINGCVDLVKDVLPQFSKELEKSAEKNRAKFIANTNPQVDTKKSENTAGMRDSDVQFARTVGQRTRALREQKGLSREQLAQMVREPQRAIVRLEDGGRVAAATLRRVAEALGVPLDVLIKDDPRLQTYHSVFLSYGGPDEPIARRFYEELTGHAIRCFFFPVSAIPGVRLHRTMSQGVDEYDRVVLLCSENSLHRPGLLNELEQVLIREAREGGSELLIPVALDNAVFTEWAPERRDLASQVRSRVVADFRRAIESPAEWANQVDRLLQSLTITRAGNITSSRGRTV